jgi:hypothetical protein
MNFFEQYHIIIIGCLFLGILIGMTVFTWREKRWVKKNYNKQDIIALGFGITCFGLSSDQGAIKKYKGFLVVHKKGLLFKGRFSDIIFDIPIQSIKKVYHGDSHKETRLYQSAVKVDFLTQPEIKGETLKIQNKIIDTIAFKVAYPAQWIKIVNKHLLKG